MIRVVHVVNTMRQGGEETLLLRLCPRLREFGVEPVVASITGPGPVSEELESQGVPLLDLSTQGRPDVRAVTRLWRFLRRGNVDLVHNHSVQATLVGDVAGKLARKPVVCTRHFSPAHPRFNAPVYQLERFVTRRLADRVIAISDRMREELILQRLAPTECVVVLRNGIDVNGFEPRLTEQFKTEPVVIGTVGRLERVKAHEIYLEVIHRVTRDRPTVRGLLAGGGSRYDELVDLRGKLNLENSVEMPGAVEPGAIPDLLGRLSVFLLTSISEGLPIGLIEAAAAGIPAVSTDVGGVSEVIIDGVTGFLTPVGDVDAMTFAVARLVDDPVLAARMGSAARTHVQAHFDISILAENTARLYREVLAERGTTRT